MMSPVTVARQTPSAESVSKLFRTHFGRFPHVVASAPGRVNLIGEHIDYNGGEVLPIAISRRTWVVAALRESEKQSVLRAVSATEQEACEVPLKGAAKSGRWCDYVLGVAEPLLRRAAAELGDQLSLDVAVWSDIPPGAGLSSSAALEVASALAISSLLGHEMDARDAAMAAWRAETEFVGVACGIMDQFASALAREGYALHIDCETAETDHAAFSDTVLIIDSAVRRSLRDSRFNERKVECAEALSLLRQRWPSLVSLAAAEPEQVLAAGLPQPLDRRALHVSRETRRVREAITLLRAGQPLTRELLVGSHDSLRDLYECSRPELDWLVQRAIGFTGVRGARLTGAGWGGCVIVVGDSASLQSAQSELARDYRARFGLAPQLWSSGAAPGARIERTA